MTMTVADQKLSETIPKMLSLVAVLHPQ